MVTILSDQSAVSIVFKSHFSIGSARLSSLTCWRWYKKKYPKAGTGVTFTQWENQTKASRAESSRAGTV